MFDFLFKRRAAKPDPIAAAQPQPAKQTQQAGTLLLKQAAMAQAARLNGEESGAVAFILQCQFADARLKAAEYVHSKPMLEQVAQAMRNADRRVAKLMQARLDALARQAAAQQRALRCVEDGLRLTQEAQLMPNQVADLDRAWQSVGAVAPAAQQAFAQARAALDARLQAQASLQRAVIDGLARMRSIMAGTPVPSPEQIAAMLEQLAQELARHRAAPEAAALPKHLLPEFAQRHHELTQSLALLAQRHAALGVRQRMLEDWEASPLAALETDAVRLAWRALPPVSDADALAPLQARYDALLQRIAAARPIPGKPQEVGGQDGQQDARRLFLETLAELEQALQGGLLQLAAEHDKSLRAIDWKAAQPSPAHAARLAKARAELSRLQGWARWGGGVSREELLKAAEGLPPQALPAPELAQQVGRLRQRWKALDASAGPAQRDLWERFDAACSIAYAPAAEYFKKLADARQQNLAAAQAMIAEVEQFAAASRCASDQPAAVDWKGVAAYCLRVSQAWQALGAIDRKEKKRLDQDFGRALHMLSDPLALQRAAEIQRREKMIEEAAGLDPRERTAPDTLRALQARWQERALALPLERRDEQMLWRRFRDACDAAFAVRKEGAAAADAERRRHLSEKEALCAMLETACDGDEAALLQALNDGKQAWRDIGPVPRAAEMSVEARYQAAAAVLQQRLDAARRTASAAQFEVVRAKFRLCQTLEQALLEPAARAAEGRPEHDAAWRALRPLPAVFERSLRERFDAAQAALQTGDRHYVALLEDNRALLSQELLRFEILAGIDSPPALSRQRLQLQVEVLQSSLQAGQKPLAPEAQLLRLCTLAAAADGQAAARIERLLGQYRETF